MGSAVGRMRGEVSRHAVDHPLQRVTAELRQLVARHLTAQGWKRRRGRGITRVG
jgi:hypothetical protein